MNEGSLNHLLTLSPLYSHQYKHISLLDKVFISIGRTGAQEACVRPLVQLLLLLFLQISTHTRDGSSISGSL